MDPSGVLCHLATLPGLFKAIYDWYLFDDTTVIIKTLTYSGPATDRTIKNIRTIWFLNAPSTHKPITYSKRSATLLNKFSKKYKSQNYSSIGVVYKIPCNDCDKSYSGQTGRKLAIRINDHKSACKNNSKKLCGCYSFSNFSFY